MGFAFTKTLGFAFSLSHLGSLGEGWLRVTDKIDPNARWEDDPSQKVCNHSPI